MCADCDLQPCPDCGDMVGARELAEWSGVCAGCGIEAKEEDWR
jgi:hypothetical protein